MHQTVSEFFLRPDGPATNSQFRMTRYDAHTTIITTCIRYLIFFSAHTYPKGDSSPPRVDLWATEDFEAYVKYLEERPLIHYALSHLQDHLCQISGFPGYLVSQLLTKLAAGNPASYLLEPLMNQILQLPQASNRHPLEFRNSCIKVAATIGFVGAVGILLIAGVDIENCDEFCQTPLIISAGNGHEATTRLLLDRGANINARDSRRLTALHCAATSGFEAITRLLLDRGANIDAVDTNASTVLHKAAASGNEATTRLLLDQEPKLIVWIEAPQPHYTKPLPLGMRLPPGCYSTVEPISRLGIPVVRPCYTVLLPLGVRLSLGCYSTVEPILMLWIEALRPHCTKLQPLGMRLPLDCYSNAEPILRLGITGVLLRCTQPPPSGMRLPPGYYSTTELFARG